MADVIKIDVPTFIRLLELAREEIDNDMDLHDIAEKVIELSQNDVVTMADYDEITDFMKSQGNNDSGDDEYSEELANIRRLGGMGDGS